MTIFKIIQFQNVFRDGELNPLKFFLIMVCNLIRYVGSRSIVVLKPLAHAVLI